MKESLLTILAILLLTWLINGVPLHKITPHKTVVVKPMQPSAEVPVFDPTPKEYILKKSENPQVKKADDLLYALSEDPCNTDLKKELKKSLKPFYWSFMKLMILKDFSEENAVLFSDFAKIFDAAVSDGYILKKDVPFLYRFLFSKVDWEVFSACVRYQMQD